jgi:hypothetical protein
MPPAQELVEQQQLEFKPQQLQLEQQQLFAFEQFQLQLQQQLQLEQQLQLQQQLQPKLQPLATHQAASCDGSNGFQLRLCPPAPAWRRPSASGMAVAQKPHSAESRPTYQCVRPQPGQWFTSFSR